MRRLLFGGTFDPVHTGHLEVARAAARLLGADRVSLVPAADPPHKQGREVAPAADRLEMCRRAVASDPLFDVLDVEVRRGGASYTIDTIRELKAGPCRGDSLVLLVGQDALADLPAWRSARELAAEVPIAVVPRPGAPTPPWDDLARALGADAVAGIRARSLPVRPVDLSSSTVRARARAGKSVRCWVPDPVADYIESRGLYGATPRST
jgi:nicotinate-nucleotide adenylyltransferase